MRYNMPVGVTEVSNQVHQLHMLVFWICVAIGILVFTVMFYSIIFHRKRAGHEARNFHENTWLEIVWTLIPFFILVAVAFPATKTLLKMENIEDTELSIKVTGFMWRWRYEYLGTNLAFNSDLATPFEQIINRAPKDENYLREVDNPLVLPVGRKVRLLMTGNDVIHSWWVPELAVKKDTIPGFINETWTKIDKPGIYRGQCAELCGARHAYMPIVVKALPAAEFDDWLAGELAKVNNSPQSEGHAS